MENEEYIMFTEAPKGGTRFNDFLY